MPIRGKVIDSVNGEPLAGASITLTDKNGKSLGQGVTAGNDGRFYLESNLLDQPGTKVLVSFVSFMSVMYDPGILSKGDYYEISLIPDGELDAVIVTPHKSKSLWLLLILIATGFAVFYADSVQDRRKRYKTR